MASTVVFSVTYFARYVSDLDCTPLRAEGDESEMEVVEKIWLPPRDSNPDMLIQSQLSCR